MKALRITEERYQELLKRGRFGGETTGLPPARNPTSKPSKHRAIKTEVAGEKFDSKLEARVYQELKLREVAGEIRNLRRQVKFSLFANGGYHLGTYKADAEFEELYVDHNKGGEVHRWIRVVADVKSQHTRKLPGWGRTKKLMQACHNIIVRELP